MTYNIVAEAHCGVFEVDKDTIMTVQAETEEEALQKAAALHRDIHFVENWSCWVIGEARQVKAVLDESAKDG